MGFFLFINSFYTFSILFLKAAVSLSSLSHLPVTLDFHSLIYKSEVGSDKGKAQGNFPEFKLYLYI